MKTVGLISPGEMGASIGAAAKNATTTVIWAGDGRSEASHTRANTAELTDCNTVEQMVTQADIILSVCPPHDAHATAATISGLNFTGVFVDCNAISPERTRQLSTLFESGKYVDGGIVGGPAWTAAAGTRLYLSGEPACQISELFEGSPLATTVISDEIGAASAMKMVFAAYTKGSIALLAAILGVAESQGVREVLEQQWGSEFSEQTHHRLVSTAVKGWRFEGEMHEIADTFAESGFSDGFHRAAGDVYSRMHQFKDNEPSDIKELLAALLRSS